MCNVLNILHEEGLHWIEYKKANNFNQAIK